MAVPRITSADLKRRIDARRAPGTVYIHAEAAFESDSLARCGATRSRSGLAFRHAVTLSIHLSGTST
jgi:hypothetical protein